ncbi:MAG: hypothetical protein ACI9R3_005723 [Verrucomicrobiales bacterium]|jgi:hypothetical protein
MRYRLLAITSHLILLSVFSSCWCHSQDSVETLQAWPEWKARCLALPSNQQILQQRAAAGKSAISSAQFDRLLEKFFAAELTGNLARDDRWVLGKPQGTFFDFRTAYFKDPENVPFQPFAQKLTLNSASTVIFNGDLHGDIRSLVRTLGSLQERGVLEGFELADPDTHLVFLGDYTDRGSYGVEVIATLLRLKLANPGNVWLSRGNHEDFQLVHRYGFVEELLRKFGAGYDVSRAARLYDCLPVVIYVGTAEGDYLQCNHGGMESGFAPTELLKKLSPAIAYQLLGTLNQASFVKAHPELLETIGLPERNQLHAQFADFVPLSPTIPRTLGFMWNDFTIFTEEPALDLTETRGWVFGQKGTATILKAHSSPEARIRAVFRAHQHTRNLSPMMQRLLVSQGVFRHWQTADAPGLATASKPLLKRLLDTEETRKVEAGAVYTFNVSPDSVYGLGCYYNFATHGILTMAPSFDEWKLEVVALPVAVE